MLSPKSLSQACNHKAWQRKLGAGPQMCRLASQICCGCADAWPEINARWEEFRGMHRAGEKEWFSEMCFCLLTANTSAEMGLRVQQKMGYEGFAKTPSRKLASALKRSGSRFYNTRAKYILLARKHDGRLKKHIAKLRSGLKAREWLAANVKGMGYKEASHFLRNVGYGDVAILDKHIVALLREHGLIGEFKSMDKKRYIAIENVLRHLSELMHMPLGKLDLCLWYLKTGKVLK